jgi:dienelactone hydrolase
MKTDFTADAFLQELYPRLAGDAFAGAHDAESAAAARDALRENLRKNLGLPVLEALACGGAPAPVGRPIVTKRCTAQKYAFEILPGLVTPLWLLTPAVIAENTPGAVALCGHGYGVRQIVGVTKYGKRRVLPYFDDYQRRFAVELVKRGCIVAAPEPVAFGEARLKKDLWKPFYAASCDTVSHRLLPYGLTTAGVRVFQAIACLHWLQTLQHADAQRIGVMGISGGGLAALYASVCEPAFARTAVSGYVCTFRDSILSRWHCPDNYIPGILRLGEMGDFAAAVAPRPLLIESGTRDPLFPIAGAKEAHERARRVYGLMGASDALIIDVFNGKHRVSGAAAFAFMSE